MKHMLQLSAVTIAVFALLNASALVAQSKADADDRVAMAKVPVWAAKQLGKQLGKNLGKDDLSPDPGWEAVHRIEAHQEAVERQMERASQQDNMIEQDRLMQDWDRLEHDKEHVFDIPEPEPETPDVTETDSVG